VSSLGRLIGTRWEEGVAERRLEGEFDLEWIQNPVWEGSGVCADEKTKCKNPIGCCVGCEWVLHTPDIQWLYEFRRVIHFLAFATWWHKLD
jgi:hypothetical protein